MKGFQCFKLTDSDRDLLGRLFNQDNPDFIGDHITIAFDVSSTQPLPDGIVDVVGVTSVYGVQALVCTVDGTTQRPDGKFFHITWSINRRLGFKPVHSNDAIASDGFTRLDTPIRLGHKMATFVSFK